MNNGIFGVPRLTPENGVIAKASHNTTQSILNATFTYVALNTTDFDSTGGMHSDNVNNGRLTAPYTGYYLVTSQATFEANATGVREIHIVKNRNTYLANGVFPGSSATPCFMPVTVMVFLNEGDFVEIAVSQNSTGTRNLNAAAAPHVGTFLTLWKLA